MSQLKVNSIVPVGGLPADTTGGGIIQIVKNEKKDTSSSTTINAFADLPGANVTITPSSNSSKIYGNFGICYGLSTYHFVINFRILRGSSHVASDVADAAGGASNFQTQTYGLRSMHDTNGGGYVNLTFLDEPATTSAVTYKLQYYAVQSGTYYLNRSGTDGTSFGRGASTFTVMEISG